MIPDITAHQVDLTLYCDNRRTHLRMAHILTGEIVLPSFISKHPYISLRERSRHARRISVALEEYMKKRSRHSVDVIAKLTRSVWLPVFFSLSLSSSDYVINRQEGNACTGNVQNDYVSKLYLLFLNIDVRKLFQISRTFFHRR